MTDIKNDGLLISDRDTISKTNSSVVSKVDDSIHIPTLVDKSLSKVDGYFYIIHVEGLPNDVYKLGMTERKNPYERFSEYAKGSKVYLTLHVLHARQFERTVLNHFKNSKFKKYHKGLEYFIGNVREMMREVIILWNDFGSYEYGLENTNDKVTYICELKETFPRAYPKADRIKDFVYGSDKPIRYIKSKSNIKYSSNKEYITNIEANKVNSNLDSSVYFPNIKYSSNKVNKSDKTYNPLVDVPNGFGYFLNEYLLHEIEVNPTITIGEIYKKYVSIMKNEFDTSYADYNSFKKYCKSIL
jgi:hypothetical protein